MYAPSGAGPIRIKDYQLMTWRDENSLDIISNPEVQVSYAKALKTTAELRISGSSAGVSIDVTVVVSGCGRCW
jgi:hypothetical protein